MRRLIAPLAVFAALAACSGDETRGVLQEDDLPSVSDVSTSTNLQALAVCSAIKEAEFTITIGNRPKGVTRAYTLDNGDYVGSSLLGTARRYGTAEAALARVTDAIETCAAEEPQADETFGPLTGLDSGAIGYRSTFTTSNGRRTGERVFAVRGDRIVVVGTRHDGEGGPKVDVVKLLPKALERAADAPRG